MIKIFSLMCLILSSLLVGCGDTERPLRLGLNVWPGYECLSLAKEKGYFEKEGVELKLLDFNSLSDTVRLYSRGQLDIMCGTMIEFLLAENEAPQSSKIIRVFDFSEGGDVILANASIEKTRDLKGKRIGLEVRSLNIFMLKRALDIQGLTLDDVILVETPQSSLSTQMKLGNIDAAVTYPPASVAIGKLTGVHTVFSSKDIPKEVIDIMFVRGDILKERREDVKGVLRAYERAFEYLKSEPKESMELMAARENISFDDFKYIIENEIKLLSYKEQQSYYEKGGPLEHSFNSTRDALKKIGAIGEVHFDIIGLDLLKE